MFGKNTLRYISLLCLLMILLHACAKLMPTPEPVTITFAYPARDTAYYETLVQEFQEQNSYITVELVKDVLRDIVKGQEKQITVENIQKTVAAYYKIRLTDMKSAKRSRVISHPRQIAMYLCKNLTGHSYPAIGHQFGGRDHTTVLHAVRKVDERRESDPVLAEELESLTAMLQK